MSDTPKIKQKNTEAFRSKANVKKMLSFTERIDESKTKETDQLSNIKLTEKISKARSKHILQNYSDTENRNMYVESKENINGGKSSKKTTINNYTNNSKNEGKARNLQNIIFLTQLRKSNQNQNLDKECLSKESLQPKSPEKSLTGSINKTIFVSLDFIEDCQKYKKKFMKPMCGQELKSLRKSLRNISSYHKRYLNNTERTQILQKDKTYKQIQKSKTLSQKQITTNSSPDDPEGKVLECFAVEDSTTSKKIGADAKATATEEPFNDELSSQWEKLATKTFPVSQSLNSKQSSEDVSTVDKKYIELLLSIANTNESKKPNMKNNDSKLVQRDKSIPQSYKKKISGKTYFENKIKKEKLEEKNSEENDRRFSEIPKKLLDLNNTPVVPQEDTVFARLVRDLTKSEVRFLPQKRNDPHSGRNSEIQRTKKIAHSKPEVNENRQRRKTRNNVLKNNKEDVIEMPFPCEISKVADVKELWRRGSPKQSENSLTSHSSSTVHESEKIHDGKNLGLESYKILKKIVEEEVKTICKSFVEEKSEKKEIDFSRNENDQKKCEDESEKLKKVCRELQNLVSENANDIFDVNGNKAEKDASRRPCQEEKQKLSPNYEGKKDKDEFLRYLDKYDPKLLEEKKDLPSEVVKNWSILHRLEQAFLALGTPTFPNHKLKDSNKLKTVGAKGFKKSNEDMKYNEKEFHQKSNKLQKSTGLMDKQEKKNSVTVISLNPKYQSDASQSHNSKPSSKKTVLQNPKSAKAESDNRQPLQKEKLQGTNNPTTGRQKGTNALNPLKISEGEDKSKQKKGKSQNQKPNFSETKKSPPRSLAKPKVFEFESRYSKRDVKQKKCKHNAVSKNSLSAKIKSLEAKSELSKKKPSNTVTTNLNQNEEENLERKKTFDVIPLKVSSKIKPRKSKSYNKIDDNLELDNTKKRFPPTRSADSKNPNFWNLTEIQQNVNDQIKTHISKLKPAPNHKTSPKCKPLQTQERPKTVSEKECSRGNRETSLKVAKDRLNQDKKGEKTMPEEDLPRQLLARKEINICQDRAVKERSILSMRGNQHANQTQRKNLLHIQRKAVCNLAQEQGANKPVQKLLEEDPPKDIGTLLDMCSKLNTPESLSFSCASTGTFDVADCTFKESSREVTPQITIANLNEYEILEELSSLSNLSLCALEQQQNDENKEIKCSKRQPIWEQDIKQYRAIVKEIMSQYKRIDGFLKQNEHSRSLPNDSVSFVSKDEASSENSSTYSKNCQEMNLYEYRKKILSEYQALPIFEYKTKLQQEAGSKPMEERRRNLSFVKPLKTEMDLDVKDYQPNIQKILDSQLYVDTENIFKRKELYVKFSEKKSSLQQIVPSKNEKMLKEEECLRSISTPKTFLSMSRGPVLSSSEQNFTAAMNTNNSMGIEMQLLKI